MKGQSENFEMQIDEMKPNQNFKGQKCTLVLKNVFGSFRFSLRSVML